MFRSAVLLAVLPFLIPPGFSQTFLVAPLENRSRNSNLDWIGESIAESVRAALLSSDLAVLSREERESGIKRLSLKPGAPLSFASLIKLTENLEAAFLVHGYFEFTPSPAAPPSPLPGDSAALETADDPLLTLPAAPRGQLRIDVRIYDRKHVLQTTEVVERGPIEDLAMLETLVSYRVVHFLVKDFQLSREEFERRHPPLKLTAKEYYIRGLMASSKEARHRYFAQAVRLEPSFAQPCFYLGRMQWDMDNYRVAAGWLERISPDQEHYWDAQFFLGLSRYQSANFEAALEAFRRLAARHPLPEVVNNLGAVELALDLPDALTHFKAALAKDPSDPDYHFNVAYALWRRGDFAAAAQGFRAVLDRVNDDQDAILLLGRSLKESGPRQGELRLEGLERLKEEIPK
ncbi:MAG: tetratricopeptide repeat protein [Acidobacteria bacterium]|nr:tetratricopeptide repeat protein [Acidobacteriota bacterium]